jgi:hypothetical protein
MTSKSSASKPSKALNFDQAVDAEQITQFAAGLQSWGKLFNQTLTGIASRSTFSRY